MKRALVLLLPVLLIVVGIVFISPSAQADGGDFRIRASTDDAEQQSDRTVLDSSDLEMANDNGKQQVVGLRFTQVAVPPGATITRAHVQFTADTSTSTRVPLTIHGQAADDPGTFTRVPGDVSNRPRTTASAGWTPAAWSSGKRGPAQQTSDLTAVVQEIVSRPGWASGNAVAVIITSANSNKRVAESFDTSASKAPALHVEWTTAATPPSAPAPEPALGPAPEPEPTAAPAPEATTVPEPTPEATTVPQPTPEPAPAPNPTTAPTTDPAPVPPSAGVRFPADSGVINLAAAPYNVRCDGVTDNTAAIQNALNTYANTGDLATRFSFRTLALPAGTCLVSNTLHSPGNAIRLVGAGQDTTVLKLKDNAGGYGSAGSPKYVYRPGIQLASTGNDNTAYANYLQDLTIDVGAGNPGAVGVRWAACNSGAMERVTIKAPANSGLRGMTMETGTGPSMVQDVTIDGFAVGIWTNPSDAPVNDLTFHSITLKNQRTVAIQNNGRSLIFEGLTVSGAPQAYEATNDRGVLVAVDVTLTGPGSGTAVDLADSFAHLRNVTASGWGNLVSQGATNRFVAKTAITEWSTADYRRGNTSVAWTETSPVASLNLAHPDAPRSSDYDLTHWVRANATSGNSADDDGPAIQAAIDSGKQVVYLPYGDYTVKTPVIVRGNVQAIDFMGSRVADANTGKISVGNSTSPFVELRNASATVDFEQNGPDAMVLRNMGAIGSSPGGVTTGPSATGDLYVDNASGRLVDISRPINAYLRQLNREGRAASVSGGATAWIFGENMETHDDKGDPYMTISGSTVEVLAGSWDNLADLGRFNSQTGPAAYAATNSRLSIVMPGTYRNGAVTGQWVSDVTNVGSVGNVTSDQVITGTAAKTYTRVVLPLYVSP